MQTFWIFLWKPLRKKTTDNNSYSEDIVDQGVEHPDNWLNVDAESYSNSQEQLTLNFSRNAFRLIKLETGSKLLDVACGTGGFSIHLKKLGFDVLAVDFSEPMLEYLKLRDASIQCQLADGHTLDGIQSNHFDCVTSFFGIYTFQDRMAGWRSAYRVLKNGGTLIASSFDMTSNKDLFSLQNMVPQFFPEDKKPLPYKNGADFKKTILPCQLSDKNLFIKELQNAGFRDIQIYQLTQSVVFTDREQAFQRYLKLAQNVAEIFESLSEQEKQKCKNDYWKAIGFNSSGPIIVPAIAHIAVAKK